MLRDLISLDLASELGQKYIEGLNFTIKLYFKCKIANVKNFSMIIELIDGDLILFFYMDRQF